MATPELSVALATLLRGPLHAEDAPPVWRSLTAVGPQLREHLQVLGVRLVIDDTEQYAYLQQLDELPEGMPRLARRHALTYGSTVLLILLRQRMTTAEADGETPRLIVTAAEMTEWMRLYRRDGVSEERIAGDIAVLVKLGYLRRLRDSDDTYEVRRIIKALVTADWLVAYRDRLVAAANRPGDERPGGQPATDAPSEAADEQAATEVEEQGVPA